MKKNKKGFTLIELLAVIVILGVLLLIAVPAATSIINSSKKKSFESVSKLALENVEAVASTEKAQVIEKCYVKLINIDLERGNFGKVKEVNGVKTEDGWAGYIIVNSDGKGTILYTNGVYKATGTLDNLKVEKETGKVEQVILEFDSDMTNQECLWYK